MNTIYKTSLLVGILGISSVSANISAQTAVKDTILNRQVNLEREYTPVLKDASKINTTPALHVSQQTQQTVRFENTTPSLSIGSFPIQDTGSGDINTDIKFNNQKGYLILGAGMYLNLEGVLGIRAVDTKNDKFDIFASHNSTNGKVKYIDADPNLEKVKAKNMENFVKMKYSHNFGALDWYINGSFLNNGFDYYGNPYVIPMIGSAPSTEYLEKNQTINLVEAETGVNSAKNSDTEYNVSIKYNNISYKYGPNIDYDGIKANLFDANFNLVYKLDSDKKAGIRAGLLTQSISDPKFKFEDDAFHGLTIVKADPYFNLDGGNYSLTLGANINYAFDEDNKFVITPNIKASWNFEDKSSLYLNVDGGINDNSVVQIFKENRYVNTDSRVAYSQTLYDAQLGVKSGAINGFEFDIFGGYKYTKDEHLYNPGISSVQGMPISWYNVSTPTYSNLGTGNIGGLIKTKLIPYTDLSAKVVAYFYNVSKYTKDEFVPTEKKAWGLPTFTTNITADFSFIDNLTLSLEYLFEGGRKAYNGTSISMKNVNELNFKGSYDIVKNIAVYARINNVLNQKYERYYGYRLQGISALGGVSVTF